MIVLGIILALIGYFASISILTTIGIILVVVGAAQKVAVAVTYRAFSDEVKAGFVADPVDAQHEDVILQSADSVDQICHLARLRGPIGRQHY